MKNTSHGTFRYEHDGNTPIDDPGQNEYYVYLDGKEIGYISLNYEVDSSLSNRYGWCQVRGDRYSWTFHNFDHDILPQEDNNPIHATNMEFPPHEFHNIKGAFKRCVELICQHLDSKDHTKKWTTWEQTIVWNYCPECSISWHIGDEPTCTCGDEVVA